MATSVFRPRLSRRTWIAVGTLAVLAGLAATLVHVMNRDDKRTPGPWTASQEALFAKVVPRPSCPRAQPLAEPPSAGHVIVDHTRVENGCMVIHSETVVEAEASERVSSLRGEPGVLAADVRGRVEPELDPPSDDDLLDLGLPSSDLRGLRHVDELTTVKDHPHLWWSRNLQREAMHDAIDRRQAPVKVAVIDTDGIDREHPEMRDVGTTIYHNSHHADGDRGSHATAVSSLIAAHADTTGFTGLMPHVELLTARATVLADEITWAVNQGARVINMSFREQCFRDFKMQDCPNETTYAAIEKARRHGVILVAAAGNHRDEDSPVIYPAGYDGVIGVGGHDSSGAHNEGMSVNESVDISAPGTDLMVAGWVPTKEDGPRCRDGYTDEHDLWCVASGTSLAAPLVTATAAWLVNQHPGASRNQIEQAILRSASPAREHISGYRNDKYGWGYLNPLGAREELGRLIIEDRTNRTYVAYHSGETLSVLDPVSGRKRKLAVFAGPTGYGPPKVRWSPDGRYLAALSHEGSLRWWDMATLDLATTEGDAYDEGTGVTACRWCYIDFAFTDNETIVALEGTPGRSGMHHIVTAPGRSLHHFAAATGRQITRTTTPDLSGVVGVGSQPGTLLAFGRNGGGESWARTDLIWLATDGRELRRVPLNDTGAVTGLALSPDRSRIAYSIIGTGFPDKEPRLINTTTAAITAVPHPFGGSGTCQCAYGSLRWTAAGTFTVSPFYAAPYPAQQTQGLAAYHDGAWHRIDGDPLIAAAAIGPIIQVVLVRQAGMTGSLYVLRLRTYGEPGDVYAQPKPADTPVAVRVSDVWFSPGGVPEPPFTSG